MPVATAAVFILRVEDTDRERSTPEAVQVILDGMQWLGLDADEGPFYQTKRYPRYREVIQQWLTEGKAYHCWCSKDRARGHAKRPARAQGEAALRRALPQTELRRARA